MKKLRVLILAHEELIPPPDAETRPDEEMMHWKAEFDVGSAVDELGHEKRYVGLSSDLQVLRDSIEEFRPHIVFNLLEEFHDSPLYDFSIVAYLELLRQPYTGCNPRGLMLSHDKVLTKKILAYHRILTPSFFVCRLGKRVPRYKLSFPMIVKSATEDASLGISAASVVHTPERLEERIQYVHDQIGTDALVEEYIEGRELYLGVLGNERLTTLPVREIDFSKLPANVPKIASQRVKWDLKFAEKYDIRSDFFVSDDPILSAKIAEFGKRIYRRLHLSGYARLDLRLQSDGALYLLEANANPNISFGEDFPEAAAKTGLTYPALIQRILSLGRQYRSEWKK